MKKLILSLFVCVLSVFCSLDAQIYQPSIYDRSERKTTIGYTTNYSNGKFNSSVYDGFNSGLNSDNHKPNIRRSIGYDDNGNQINTDNLPNGNPNPMWEDGYEYYWDGSVWWRHAEFWFIVDLGWQWWDGSRWRTSIRINPPSDIIQYYKENPLPLKDIYPLFILVILYTTIKQLKLKQNEKLDLERMGCFRFSSSCNNC